MSNFQQGTKSKQRGVITITGTGSGPHSATATLTPAVDPAKTNTVKLGQRSQGSSAEEMSATVVLTDGSTVTAQCKSATNGDVFVSWEIQETYR